MMRSAYKIAFLSVLAIACIACCAPETPVQPKKNLSVTLKETSVTLPFETEVKVDYTYADAEGTLVVDSKNLPEGISFTNNVTSKSKGSISFFSGIDADMEHKVTLIFGDKNNTVNKDITLNTQKKIISYAISVETDLDSDIVYPYPSNIATEIPFTVKCESTIDELTIEAGTGLKATINTASNKKSGKISIVAESNLGTSANVTITAKNSAGSASKSFSLVKAYLDLSGYECSVPYTGTKQAYNFIVSTNLEYNVNVENAAKEYVSYTIQNNSVNFNVTENPKWEARVAKITVSDKKNILSREFVITQAMTEGSNASDREALMAIYKSLNMKEWTDYGSFGTYYKNWGTDVSMDKWLGLERL